MDHADKVNDRKTSVINVIDDSYYRSRIQELNEEVIALNEKNKVLNDENKTLNNTLAKVGSHTSTVLLLY